MRTPCFIIRDLDCRAQGAIHALNHHINLVPSRPINRSLHNHQTTQAFFSLYKDGHLLVSNVDELHFAG
jgi:hypothetical protein